MVIKQAAGVQAAVKVLGVREPGDSPDHAPCPAPSHAPCPAPSHAPAPVQDQGAGRGAAVVKAPKTIHRCILKTSVGGGGVGGGAQRLWCHVCLVTYPDYPVTRAS